MSLVRGVSRVNSFFTFSDLFQQGIQESGAVLTCFEGAMGPSYRNFYFAQQACNYTTDQWNSGNYNLLKSCLMNMTIDEGLNNHNVRY